jgi:putative addiction module component (TIGR02574 family)
MRTNELSKILELSIAQRLLIVEQIWDSIAESNESLPLSDNRKHELDKRLNSYYENPEAGTPWQEVKERLLSTK